MTEFFVVMVKRGDGLVYADLHKTDGKIYLTRGEAEAALKPHFHVVRLIAALPNELETEAIS